MISSIIFDWHGVLDQTKLENLVKTLSSLSKKERDEVKDILKPFERSYAAGSASPGEFWTNVRRALGLNKQQVEEAKKSILKFDPYFPLWGLLPSLKENYPLAILSDCPQDKVDIIRSAADLSYFKKIHFSCEKHLFKDSDEFFMNIVEELHEQPENCLYVDDTERHVKTAKRLGLQVCHFKTVENLENSLI